MKDKEEGGHKVRSSEENDKHSPFRIALQAKAGIEPDNSHNNDTRNGNWDGDIMNYNEERHNPDNPKAIEDKFRHDDVEETLTQILKYKNMLLDEKDERLENKEKLLRNQSELL